jgi:hypothetical protein
LTDTDLGSIKLSRQFQHGFLTPMDVWLSMTKLWFFSFLMEESCDLDFLKARKHGLRREDHTAWMHRSPLLVSLSSFRLS